MGNLENNFNLQQKYTYISVHNDPNFGRCKIYRKKQQNFQYVLQIHRYLTESKINLTQESLKDFKNKYFLESDFPFLRIFDWRISNEGFVSRSIVNSCKIPEAKIYIEFLRHNLKQFLEWRKSEERPLNYDEIIFALSNSLKAFQKTKSTLNNKLDNQILNISLNLQDISITVEGEIKFNPLIQNFKNKQNNIPLTFFKSYKNSPSKEGIIAKKYTVKNKVHQKIFLDKKDQNYFSQRKFLNQLKKFANQLVWECRNYVFVSKNPEESQFQEKKQIKRLLAQIHKAKTIKEMKLIIGQTHLKRFFIQFDKLKHQQSEARFQKIASEFQYRSQRTDYSLYQNFDFRQKVMNQRLLTTQNSNY